jgi:serine-type D-Ala-D-Ala carboxypeptidase (penicillin-binding protein 5/6)
MEETDQNNLADGGVQKRKKNAIAVSPLLLSSLLLAAVWIGVTSIAYLSHSIPEPVIAPTIVATKQDPFELLNLNAKSAIVYDLTTRTSFFAYADERQLPLASLTKLMTALVTYESLDENYIVTIPYEAIAEAGDSGFIAGETWRLKDLIDFTLMTSSNDGAAALALSLDSPSISVMNQRADELGLIQSYFGNPTGLDNGENSSGTYGSAKDVAELLSYIVINSPEILDATRYDELDISSISAGMYHAKNTNKSISKIPALIGGKTGFTELAGGNLAFVFDAGPKRPVAVVVLGSTEDGRFEDAEKLVKATLEYIRVFFD